MSLEIDLVLLKLAHGVKLVQLVELVIEALLLNAWVLEEQPSKMGLVVEALAVGQRDVEVAFDLELVVNHDQLAARQELNAVLADLVLVSQGNSINHCLPFALERLHDKALADVLHGLALRPPHLLVDVRGLLRLPARQKGVHHLENIRILLAWPRPTAALRG